MGWCALQKVFLTSLLASNLKILTAELQECAFCVVNCFDEQFGMSACLCIWLVSELQDRTGMPGIKIDFNLWLGSAELNSYNKHCHALVLV